jgi:hypothetical protein
MCLPSGYSPNLSASHGRLMCVDELARRDMVARVGEGNREAPVTKDGETKEEVGREPLVGLGTRLSIRGETMQVKQETAGADWSFGFGLRSSMARRQAGWLIWHAMSAKVAKC